jgi:hypothetical protein
VIDNALRDRSLHRPAEKAEAVEEVLPYLKAVTNRIQKREYFDMAMDALQVTDNSLRRELWQTMRVGAPANASQRIIRRNDAKPTVAEQQLLELLLSNEVVRRAIIPRIAVEDYQELATAPLFEGIIQLGREGVEPGLDSLTTFIGEESPVLSLLPMLLIGATSEEQGKDYDPGVAAEKCLEAMRLVNINKRIDELMSEMVAAERAGDDAEKISRLATEQIQLSAKRVSMLRAVDSSAKGV